MIAQIPQSEFLMSSTVSNYVTFYIIFFIYTCTCIKLREPLLLNTTAVLGAFSVTNLSSMPSVITLLLT